MDKSSNRFVIENDTAFPSFSLSLTNKIVAFSRTVKLKHINTNSREKKYNNSKFDQVHCCSAEHRYNRLVLKLKSYIFSPWFQSESKNEESS